MSDENHTSDGPPEDAFSAAQEMDTLAGEYVLGLTPVEDEGTVRALLRNDPAFAVAVAQWQERLVAMTDDIAAVKPPRKARARLHKRLFGSTRNPAYKTALAWQIISFAALGFAAYISFFDLTPNTPPSAPMFATQISNADEGLSVLAVYDPARGGISVNRSEGRARPGRVLELWAIAPNSDPVSLGVLPEEQSARVILPDDLAAVAGMLTFAISDEPRGGSPTGAPTGDILGAGTVSQL